MSVIQNINNGQPKICILECHGGGGHVAAAQAIGNAIKSDFPNAIISKMDVGDSMAPEVLKNIIGYSPIELHNHLAQKGWTSIIGAVTNIAKWVLKDNQEPVKQYFDGWLRNLQTNNQLPELIASAVPMVNGPLLESCKNFGIPVLITSTDGDNELFSFNWPKNDEGLAPYRYTIPYNCFEISSKVDSAVDPSKIRAIGYPVRPEFLKTYALEEIQDFKDELKIPKDKEIVGIMMGSLGGDITYDYVEKIFQMIRNQQIKNVHFIVFCGRNDKLVNQLKFLATSYKFQITDTSGSDNQVNLSLGNGVSLSLLGFTKDVHKYLAMATCLISKPGSSTFNEALCQGVPLLLDATSTPIPWEELNLDMAEQYGLGKRVTKLGTFPEQLLSFLDQEENKKYRKGAKGFRNSRQFQKDFSKNIVKITKELLAEGELWKSSRILQTSKIVRTALPSFEERSLEKILSSVLFSNFSMDLTKRIQRRKELFEKFGAKPIEGEIAPMTSSVGKKPIDAIYIRSNNSERRTGNVIVFALGKDYQAFHPKNFEHLLDEGADVVLFNPTENTSLAMVEDLKRVFFEIKGRNPSQQVVFHGYSIGAHVAAAAACDLGANGKYQIPVIVDRGFGDTAKLVSKITILANQPLVRKIIEDKFDLDVENRISQHKTEMIFLSPKQGKDQLMHGEDRVNLTYDLYIRHRNAKWIELKDSDHWTPWTSETHNQIMEFLGKHGIIASNFDKVTETQFPNVKPTWFRSEILPNFF